MIFKVRDLENIKSGKISLAFRKWKKAAVRKGSRLRTAIGVVEISSVSAITSEEITSIDAVNAGFDSLENLIKALNRIDEGTIYKIELHYYSDDPRIKLRQHSEIGDGDVEVLKKKLKRLDSYSKNGKWTLSVLKAINDNPRLRAADLAIMMNKEKAALKIDIRKLKNLGLTISHETGYTISPLGKFVLEKVL
jgi:hypothetical protein